MFESAIPSRFKCFKCSKFIAKTILSCSVCEKKFHPSCVLYYLRYKTASECCLISFADKLDIMSSTSQNPSNSLIRPSMLDQLNTSMQIDNVPYFVPSQGAPPLVTLDGNSILTQILHKVNNSEAMLTMLNNKVSQFETNITSLDKKLTNFAEHQNTVNAALSNNLDALSSNVTELAKRAENQEQRSARIEQEQLLIKQQLSQVTQNINEQPSQDSTSSEVIISGVPICINDTPINIVEKVFAAVGASHLFSDVLDVSLVPRRSVTEGNVPPQTKSSFVVTLRSCQVREFVIKHRRAKKDLFVKEVFQNELPGKIFVNEKLPYKTYILYRQAKSKASAASFKYVWVNKGTILARKGDGLPVININSEEDLNKIA